MVSTYDIIAHVKGSLGEESEPIGIAGRCRFCGCTDPRKFRNEAHSLPEALGNKWITSRDECDDCNRLFSRYDDALAKSIGPILTVGGTPGKKNRVRQTGRTGGPSVIKHHVENGKRRISTEMLGDLTDGHVRMNSATGGIQFVTPVAPERFIPRYAFKALAKTAYALLPDDELPHFSKLREWLLDPEDDDQFERLIVGLSFGSVGNAPPLAVAALLKRSGAESPMPYMIFIMAVGSVCFQLVLPSDEMNGQWPQQGSGRSNIRWSNVIAAPGHDELRIEYGEPTHLDWASGQLELPPLEAVRTDFNIRTSEGSITPVFRSDALLTA